MSNILMIHYAVGFLMVLAAVGLIWRYSWRRITLYLLTLQILLGALVLRSGLRPPPMHWALAIVAWVLYMAANGMAKRNPESKIPLYIAIVASIIVLGVFEMGRHAFKAA